MGNTGRPECLGACQTAEEAGVAGEALLRQRRRSQLLKGRRGILSEVLCFFFFGGRGGGGEGVKRGGGGGDLHVGVGCCSNRRTCFWGRGPKKGGLKRKTEVGLPRLETHMARNPT